MRYFTKKQQEILKDNKFIVIDNSKAYHQTEDVGTYLNIVDEKLTINKTINNKTDVETFDNFKQFSQRYLYEEE